MSACGACQHFEARPAAIERGLPLLAAMSSAYGANRADDGYCDHHDRYVWARSRCASFAAIAAQPAPPCRSEGVTREI
jgi:hypothetical protein